MCSKCGAKIRGWYHSDGITTLRPPGAKIPLPSYCYSCGNPYPWIENNLKKLNAILLIDTVMDEEQKGIIREYLPDLVINDENANTSAVIIKAISEKASGPVKSFIIEFVKSLGVDSVKKIFRF